MAEPTISFERVDTPREGKDHCETCGVALRYSGKGRHPRFCEEHKPGASASGTPRTRKTHSKKATEEQWDTFLIIVFLAVSYAIGRFAAGGVGLLQSCPPSVREEDFDNYVEALSMTEDEAKPLAKFFAARAAQSVVNKKAGWIVVQALDLEEVGAAMWSYGKRVAPAVANRIANKPQASVPRKVASSGPLRQSAGGSAPDNIDAVRRLRRQTEPVASGNADSTA